jgi:hypothetical protein
VRKDIKRRLDRNSAEGRDVPSKTEQKVFACCLPASCC